jgi:hypothetical protein
MIYKYQERFGLGRIPIRKGCQELLQKWQKHAASAVYNFVYHADNVYKIWYFCHAIGFLAFDLLLPDRI